MLFPRRKKTEYRHSSRFGVKIESCEIRSLLSATTPLVDSVETVSAVEDVLNLPEEHGDPESRSVIEPVAEDVATSLTDGEVMDGTEVAVAGSSDFDQWYSNNRDAILAAWSNAISGLDLNDSTVDRTSALSQLWNETLRSLYGAELPWDVETVVESDAALTEDTVRVDETVGDAVVDEVTGLQTETVNLGYMSLRPVVYVYNETPADGSYGGVALELIDISSVVFDEAGELISQPVLEDRLTGTRYVLPAEVTLVSERDLTKMLASYGISEYRVEDQARWVIPVSPDEGIGFLNRAWSLTYYDEIQSYLRSAGETQTEVYFDRFHRGSGVGRGLSINWM